MHDYLLLRVLDRLERVFTSLDCDYPVMRQILQVKLTLDARRVPTVFQHATRNIDRTASSRNYSIRMLLMYGIIGLMLIPFILMHNSLLFSVSIVFAIFLFIVMTSLIADFSSVLLDVRDRAAASPDAVYRQTGVCNKTRTRFFSIYFTHDGS